MVKTIGFGAIINPEVFASMTFEEYKDAYELAGNYRNITPEEREKALKSDFSLISEANGVTLKKKVKDKGDI